MEQLILAGHLVIALVIIGLIMLQQGKGADMGASFGAGGSQTLFGSDGGGNALTRATAWLVALFFASSFSLALIADQKADPVNDLDLEIPTAVEAPAIVEDLPVVEDEIPVISDPAGDEIPAVE